MDKEQQIGAFLEPGIAGGERHDAGLAEHGHDSEVEVLQRLARRQAGFGEMALDTPAPALGDLEFGQNREEARGWPALLVGTFGEFRPQLADGRQPQLVQQQWQTGGVDLDRAHGRAHSCAELSSAS